MSTLTVTPETPVALAARSEKLSFPRLVRAEWIKFTTLRST